MKNVSAYSSSFRTRSASSSIYFKWIKSKYSDAINVFNEFYFCFKVIKLIVVYYLYASISKIFGSFRIVEFAVDNIRIGEVHYWLLWTISKEGKPFCVPIYYTFKDSCNIFDYFVSFFLVTEINITTVSWL